MSNAAEEIDAALFEAAMAHVAAHGWPAISLQAVASAAGVPEAQARRRYGDKYALVRAFGQYIDARVPLADREGSPRERLFEVLMARFDALMPYRPGLAGLARASWGDARLAFALARALPRRMRAMLKRAHIKADGIEGLVKARVLAALWLGVVRIWLKDESPDLATTMAALDRALARIEPMGERLFPHDARPLVPGA